MSFLSEKLSIDGSNPSILPEKGAQKGEEQEEEVGFSRRHCRPPHCHPTLLPPSGVNDGVEFPGNGVASPQGVFFNAFPR